MNDSDTAPLPDGGRADTTATASACDLDYSWAVEQFYEVPYKFAFGLAGNNSDAADLTQDTYRVLLTKGDAIRDACKVKSWLFTNRSHLANMTGLKFIRTLCALALGFTLLASRAAAAEFDQAHALFDSVLKQRVKNARVDYSGLKAHPEDLNRYLDQVAAVSKAEFKKWSEPQQIAFLSNAYNAYTLKLIIDHYPLKSIKDIGSFVNGPWDQPVVKLFGKTIDLNTVEHKMLRVDYAEPRIHFALVCAAKGCPPLRGEAYVGVRLEEQLVDQAKQFLAETAKNRIAASERAVHLSPIFKWYGSDFEKESGSVLAALKPYWPEKAATTDGFKIRYTDYDWSLNEQGK